MTDKNTKLVTEVTTFEKEWSDAEVRGDRSTLDGMLTDQFVCVGPRGFVLTKPSQSTRGAVCS